MTSGAESYNVHGFFETVGPGELLVVNDGQSYESAIDAEAPVETLCVFFSHGDVCEAERLWVPESNLLDDPEAAAPRREFHAVKRPADTVLGVLLRELLHLREAPSLQRAAFSLRLLAALQEWEAPVIGGRARFDVLRRSTREELLRRCLIARAYIDACYAEDLTLPQLARAAGLSRAHFLRAFKRAFGVTPYQALRRRRLESAAAMLRQRRCSVTEAALAAGYDDFSAFSRAFRSFFGASPSVYARN